MHDYLNMVVKLECPINMCTKPEYRKQSSHRTPIYEKKVRKTLYKLTRVVEKKIGEAMKKAKRGSLMSDAWTKLGYHYLALLAVFVEQKTGNVVTVLLAMSPLPGGRHDDVEDDENTEEARRD